MKIVFQNICMSAVLGASLMACAGPRGGGGVPPMRQGMGQYQIPQYLRPEPMQRMPQDDLCRSRLFLGLVGQHEGGIVFASLPGRTRVIKPAELELDQDDFLQDMNPEPPFVRVREYLSGQILYTPSIDAVQAADNLGPIIQDRMTLELDQYGYVRAVSCR